MRAWIDLCKHVCVAVDVRYARLSLQEAWRAMRTQGCGETTGVRGEERWKLCLGKLSVGLNRKLSMFDVRRIDGHVRGRRRIVCRGPESRPVQSRAMMFDGSCNTRRQLMNH